MTETCSTAGAELVLTVSWPEILAFAGSGLLLVIVGAALLRNRLDSRWPDFLGGRLGGIGLMFAIYGALNLLVFAPSLYFIERIVISPTATCAAHGFWFWRFPPLRIEHADIAGLRHTTDGEGNSQLELRLRDGSLVRKTLPTLWSDNVAGIDAALRQRGVPVGD